MNENDIFSFSFYLFFINNNWLVGSDYDKDFGGISSEPIGNLPHMIKTWYYHNYTAWAEDKTIEVRPISPVPSPQTEQTIGDFSAGASCVTNSGSYYSCGYTCLPLDFPCNGSCLSNRCLGDDFY